MHAYEAIVWKQAIMYNRICIFYWMMWSWTLSELAVSVPFEGVDVDALPSNRMVSDVTPLTSTSALRSSATRITQVLYGVMWLAML